MKKNTKKTSQKKNVNGEKYWYATDVYACVLCGKEQKYRGRVYDESQKGIKWHDDLCWGHM
jgi:hypothetical protein